MRVVLCVTDTEEEHLIKRMYSASTLTGTLRNDSSVITPTIIIEADNPSAYNYAYVPDFHRYYYITDIVSIRKNIWEISMKSDVLMSFANYIKASTALIIEMNDDAIPNRYLENDVWVSTVRDKTDVIEFSGGFNDSPEFILITAGG